MDDHGFHQRHGMVRPWGLSYTQNITPDQETGIGAYTEAQFIQTLREGKKQDAAARFCRPCPGRRSRT